MEHKQTLHRCLSFKKSSYLQLWDFSKLFFYTSHKKWIDKNNIWFHTSRLSLCWNPVVDYKHCKCLEFGVWCLHLQSVSMHIRSICRELIIILRHFPPQGCFEDILETLIEHANIVGGIAAGIGVLEVKWHEKNNDNQKHFCTRLKCISRSLKTLSANSSCKVSVLVWESIFLSTNMHVGWNGTWTVDLKLI